MRHRLHLQFTIYSITKWDTQQKKDLGSHLKTELSTQCEIVARKQIISQINKVAAIIFNAMFQCSTMDKTMNETMTFLNGNSLSSIVLCSLFSLSKVLFCHYVASVHLFISSHLLTFVRCSVLSVSVIWSIFWCN